MTTFPPDLREAHRTVSSGARWRCLLAALLLATLCGCGKTVVLQSDLNDADANEIVALLRRTGIEAQKLTVKGAIHLQVPEQSLARATEAMRSAGLPRHRFTDLGTVFKKEGMISTPLEERARYLHGLSEELAATLQQIDGVLAARVHVVLPERVAPGEPVMPSSAAVFIKYRAPFDEDGNVARIRRMVAGSIPGMNGADGAAKVALVFTPALARAPETDWVTRFGITVLAASAERLALLVLGLGGGLLAAVAALGTLLALRHPAVAAWRARRRAADDARFDAEYDAAQQTTQQTAQQSAHPQAPAAR